MLTKKQNQKYWRIWAQLCKADTAIMGMTSAEKSEHRRNLHLKFGLPISHSVWTNSDFSRWISRTAPMLDQVDIRDRDRENALWTIERLRAAFITLLGHDYAATIMADWADTDDLDKIPLQDASRIDLENFRNTLKNRLGRVIQRLKDGELQPGPDCPTFGDASQAEIIEALIRGKKAPPAKKKKYVLQETGFKARSNTPKTPAKATRPRTTPAPRQQAPNPTTANKRQYCMH